MLPLEKSGTPAELVLQHVGVKGMKWGRHKTQATIDFYKRNPTSAQRTSAIEIARASARAQKRAIRTEKDPTKKAKLKVSYLRSPDRATAMRMTRGEKVILSILTPLIAPTAIIPAAVGATVAVRVGQRRALEERLGKG